MNLDPGRGDKCDGGNRGEGVDMGDEVDGGDGLDGLDGGDWVTWTTERMTKHFFINGLS